MKQRSPPCAGIVVYAIRNPAYSASWLARVRSARRSMLANVDRMGAQRVTSAQARLKSDHVSPTAKRSQSDWSGRRSQRAMVFPDPQLRANWEGLRIAARTRAKPDLQRRCRAFSDPAVPAKPRAGRRNLTTASAPPRSPTAVHPSGKSASPTAVRDTAASPAPPSARWS